MRSSFRPNKYDSHHRDGRRSFKFRSKGWGHNQLNDFYYDFDRNPVDLFDIDEAIDSLVQYQEYNLAEALADPSLARKYVLLLRAAKRFHGTDFYDSHIVNRLRNRNISTVRPGTLGQVLFGNLVDNRNENASCSPIQIGALPADDKLPTNCHNQVWYYDGTIFRQLTPELYPSPPNADLYIPDSSLSSLNSEQVKMLKSYGVQNVTFYTVKRIDQSSNDQVSIPNQVTVQTVKLGQSTPIELATNQNSDSFSFPDKSTANQNSTEFDTINGLKSNKSMIPVFDPWIIGIIIVVLIVILLLLVIYYVNSRNSRLRIDS